MLPFSSEAAHWYAELLRRRERMGRAMATADAVIAATALAQGASLATRDVDDFADIGLELINHWQLR
ncbi:MAG: PIN domain-containing protein [Sphaerospermopsis kisseleviana]